MKTIAQYIFYFFGIIGIGGILTAVVTAVFNKSNEIEFQKLQNNEKRYKCAILLMEVCLDFEKLKHIEEFRDELKTRADVMEKLRFEYNQMLLYSSKATITAIKNFIESPSKEFLYNTYSHEARLVD